MKKLLIGLSVVITLIIGGVLAAVMMLDVDQYRGDITHALNNKTGRTITLSSPIKLTFSLDGASLDLAGFTMSNPTWASRPDMANIPHLKVGVALLPLLRGQIVISHFTLNNADILLESADNDQHNWEFEFSKSTSPESSPAKDTPTSSATPVSVHVSSFVITNSQIGIRDSKGKVTYFKTDNLTLKQNDGKTSLTFQGSLNTTPIKLNLQTSDDDLTSNNPRPIKADLTFANLHLTTDGKLSLENKEALLDTYEVSSGKSAFNGKLAVEWGNKTPSIVGTINSNHLSIVDFKADNTPTPASDTPESPTAASSQSRLLSDAPLGLKSLESVNATLDIAVQELVAGNVALQQLDTKIILKNGELFVSPLTASLGAGKLSGQLHINGTATSPLFGLTINAADINLPDIIPAASFISGRVNIDTNLASDGDSLHMLASNLSGTLNMIGAGGDIVTRSSDQISSEFTNLLNPGNSKGEENLNCMIARFVSANGLVRSNGILLDTSAATVAGNGNIDLRGEIIDLQFRAKPKLVDTGSLLPPMHVGGTFLHPETSISASSVVENVIGNILDGESLPSQSIPDVVAEQGQNACLAALNHPTAAPATTSSNQKQGVVQKLGGKAGQLLKGIFGK